MPQGTLRCAGTAMPICLSTELCSPLNTKDIRTASLPVGVLTGAVGVCEPRQQIETVGP